MKLYLYDGLDGTGKATYQSIEIDEREAAAWVQVDFEKQRNEIGEDASPRTAQQIMDEVNAENYNSDRRYRYLQDKVQTVKTEEGNDGAEEVSRLDLISDDTYNPERELLRAESENEIKALAEGLLSIVSEKQRKRLIDYFIKGKTLTEIAEEESVHHSTIDESIKAALKKINKKIAKHPEK